MIFLYIYMNVQINVMRKLRKEPEFDQTLLFLQQSLGE